MDKDSLAEDANPIRRRRRGPQNEWWINWRNRNGGLMRTRKIGSFSFFVTTLAIVIGITSTARLQSAGASMAADALDSQQQSWGATGSLSVARSLQTATPLPNGKVLVVGGINVLNPCCTNT